MCGSISANTYCGARDAWGAGSNPGIFLSREGLVVLRIIKVIGNWGTRTTGKLPRGRGIAGGISLQRAVMYNKE
jgi:hypothetical protein